MSYSRRLEKVSIILALDLGGNTGFAYHDGKNYFAGSEKMKRKAKEPEGQRYIQLDHFLILMHKHHVIEHVFYEQVPRHNSTTSAHVYGGYCAVLKAFCDQRRRLIPYTGLTVAHIKKFAVGKGNAKKEIITAAAEKKWGKKLVVDHDAGDALWTLECGISEM